MRHVNYYHSIESNMAEVKYICFMKKFLIVLIAACAGFLNSGAQSMLKVHLADNSLINVSVDGRYFNKRGTSVTVGDLPSGRHLLQIYVVFQNQKGRARETVVYEGKVKTHEGAITIFQYDANSQNVQVDEQDINQYLNEHPIPNAEQGAENQNQNQNQDQGNNANNGNNDNNNAAAASPAPTGTLDDSKTDKLKTDVAGKKTDTEKMKVLKDALANETFVTYQVGNMMDWFSFESSKVDFAEWAYTKTVDKENFTDLENKLTYKNYRDDLDKFIKEK
jgi:hypothetical protein